MVNAGWFTETTCPLSLPAPSPSAAPRNSDAGLMEMPRGNTFGFVAFCSYGAFWWTFALFVVFFAAKVSPPASSAGGWSCGASSPSTCGSAPWRSIARCSRVPRLVGHVLPARRRSNGPALSALHMAGGYMGLLTAVFAFYLPPRKSSTKRTAAPSCRSVRPRTVSPSGNCRPKRLWPKARGNVRQTASHLSRVRLQVDLRAGEQGFERPAAAGSRRPLADPI